MDEHDVKVLLFLLKSIERLTDDWMSKDGELEFREVEEMNYEARYLASIYETGENDA